MNDYKTGPVDRVNVREVQRAMVKRSGCFTKTKKFNLILSYNETDNKFIDHFRFKTTFLVLVFLD